MSVSVGLEPRIEQEQEAGLGHHAGQHGEQRPPQHDADEGAARPEDVAEPAAGDLEGGVGEGEGREGQFQVGLAVQAEVLLDLDVRVLSGPEVEAATTGRARTSAVAVKVALAPIASRTVTEAA